MTGSSLRVKRSPPAGRTGNPVAPSRSLRRLTRLAMTGSFCLLFLFAGGVKQSQSQSRKHVRSPKAEHFFDLDKNGWLNSYERGLLTTYQRFGWKLANTRAKRKFDGNGDRMLSPYEWEKYKNREKVTKKEKKRREKAHYRKAPIKQ